MADKTSDRRVGKKDRREKRGDRRSGKRVVSELRMRRQIAGRRAADKSASDDQDSG